MYRLTGTRAAVATPKQLQVQSMAAAAQGAAQLGASRCRLQNARKQRLPATQGQRVAASMKVQGRRKQGGVELRRQRRGRGRVLTWCNRRARAALQEMRDR